MIKPEPVLPGDLQKKQSESAIKSEDDDVTIITEDQFHDQKGSASRPSSLSLIVHSFKSDSNKSSTMVYRSSQIAPDSQRLESIKGFGQWSK